MKEFWIRTLGLEAYHFSLCPANEWQTWRNPYRVGNLQPLLGRCKCCGIYIQAEGWKWMLLGADKPENVVRDPWVAEQIIKADRLAEATAAAPKP